MERRKITVKAKILNEERLYIVTDFIKLDAAMKLAGIADTGGMAKMMIEDAQVKVNGEVCIQRGKKLYPGDKMLFRNSLFVISKNEDK